MSMSMSGNSNCSSSPVSRRHSVTSMLFDLFFMKNNKINYFNLFILLASQNKVDEFGYFKNRRTSVRRSARAGTRLSQNAMDAKKCIYNFFFNFNYVNFYLDIKINRLKILVYPPTPQLTLRPLFFEVPIPEPNPLFVGREWLVGEMEDIMSSASPGIIIAGEPGTGKTAIILQLVEHSCFGRKKESMYEQMRESDDICSDSEQNDIRTDLIDFASHVVAYHFCQVCTFCTCIFSDFSNYIFTFLFINF